MFVGSHWATQVSLPGNLSYWRPPSSRWKSSTLLLKLVLVLKLVLAWSVPCWIPAFATNGKKAPNQSKFFTWGFCFLPLCLCCGKKKSESVCYHFTVGFISFDTIRKRTALVLVCLRGGLHRLPGDFRTCLGDLPISCEAAFLGGRGPAPWERWPAAGSLSAEPECHLLACSFFSTLGFMNHVGACPTPSHH